MNIRFDISPYGELSLMTMRQFISITKALGDANRVRVLLALGDRELCVCQIIELLGLAPSTVSKHLSLLAHAGLVEPRKTERWVYYRLPTKEEATKTVREAISWVKEALQDSPQAIADGKKLDQILKINKQVLCQRRK